MGSYCQHCGITSTKGVSLWIYQSVTANKIDNHIEDLKRGHIYKITKTPGTPSCATLVQHLKKDIAIFNINAISRNLVTGQFTCSCNTGSSTTAKDIQARYLIPVRERFNFTAEIEIQGSTVTIASNSPDVTKWIANQINNGQKPIIADNNPKNWQDKNGNSYSIVMLTSIMEYEPSEELQRRVSLCLNTIRDATARNLNPITV